MENTTEDHYDLLWKSTPVRDPSAWETWDIVCSYLKNSEPILELGPGTRPRFPLRQQTTVFDLSPSTAKALDRFGVTTVVGNLEKPLPFQDESFSAVGAFDVIEHVKHDDQLLSEIHRVLRPGGYFICSVPLHMRYWTLWDRFVGHYRRYVPKELVVQTEQHGLVLRAAYPTEGIFQLLATTPIAHPVAWLCIAIVRVFPRLAYAGERFFIVPALRLSTLSMSRWQRKALNRSVKDFPRRCPRGLFVFQKS